MKIGDLIKRALSVLLVLALVLNTSPLAFAAGAGNAPDSGLQALNIEKIDGVDIDLRLASDTVEPTGDQDEYAETDIVRVSIVLEQQPTLECYSTESVALNAEAMAYRHELERSQATITSVIERRALKGGSLDVVWNLTLAANLISANVEYGSIDEIAAVDGVAQVVIEKQYEPMTTEQTQAQPFASNSSGMIGAGSAWAAGYTGAGSRVAIIDTGLDTDHQSFDNGAYLYALEQLAQAKGVDAAEYIESLDLLDQAEVDGVFRELNIYPYVEYAEGSSYVSEKVPFALNYVDRGYDATHDNDGQGAHGSHVAGIAAANRYIPNGEGGYDNALDTVYTQGVAPDAQIIVMKVFGQQGGAYESDYMVAIEDAILLGCDVVNLSLGHSKGFSRSALYQDILDSLQDSDTVVAVAAGNNGSWADYSANGVGHLYADDVDLSVMASPAAADNAFAVASVDNAGLTDYYFSVGESILYYQRGVVNNAYTDGLNALGGGDYAYIYIDGIGTAEEIAAVCQVYGDVSNAILVCARGEINFSEKANNAANAGFAGTIVYNNVPGSFNMDLTDYVGTGPCVSITQADGEILKAAAVEEAGFRSGTMYISDKVMPNPGTGSFTMSSFSSWGPAGTLELKPEISAPGGEIYSVDGMDPDGDGYQNLSGTSMASPQIAGMAAVVMQYIRDNGLEEKTGLSARALTTALLMATAQPLTDEANGGTYYSVLQQGSGLANVGQALKAGAYIRMNTDATSAAADGKVKAELGDDPQREGVYTFGFTVNNFSDTPKTYSLSGDFFTQGLFESEGVMYLDTATTTLPVSVEYVVSGESLSVSSEFDCDLNGDHVTDDQDAQCILDYASGAVTEIDSKADLNADGAVNTYDAHLLLASLRSDFFRVAPGESVEAQITLRLTDKAALDAAYVNGAYVEGFVYVTAAPSGEGEVEPRYSIPVLAFYGNWSDASMYDRADYTGYLYDDFIYPYTGGLNYLSLFYNDGMDERYYVGNPYLVEDTFPVGKSALNSETELGDMAVTLIRGGAGFLFYILDGQGNVVEARSASQLYPAYYNEAYATWVNINNVGLSIWQTPEGMGFAEGDEFTIGFMALPEYYEKNGELTQEQLVALLKSGDIGSGAFHSYTFKVDDTAPQVQSVEKDAETGNLVVTASDENHIAAVAVLNAKGSNVLTMVGAQQENAGETVTTVIDMTDISVNRDCLVMVADYAGNETYYKVSGYNEGINNYTGMMYGFSNVATRGTINSWMEIEPEKLHYASEDFGEVTSGGTSDVANMPWALAAAEYVGGHVYMATKEGALYIAEQGDWENVLLVAKNRLFSSIKDMAFNTADGKLYALIGTNNLYTIDLVDGTLTKEYSVSLAFPRNVSDTNYELLTLAIDDEGSFYSVNNGDANYKRVYLFKWSEADRGEEDGNVHDLAPVNNTEEGYAGDYVYNDNINYMGVECDQSMAWDHDNDVLYWAAAMSTVSPNNILYTFDLTTGKASKATPDLAGVDEYYESVLSANVVGLYVVPAESVELPTANDASGLILERTGLELLVGARYTMDYDLLPWNLLNRGVRWSTDNEAVATVDENGVITAHSAGTALITATTDAEPNLSASCIVTVEDVQDVALKALLFDAEGAANWVSFDLLDPAAWTIQPNGQNIGYDFLAGSILGDTLFAHDGSHMYGIDADTFEVTDYGYLDPTWQWSDAAPAPVNENGYFGRIVGVINSGKGLGIMDITTGIASEVPYYGEFSKDPAALIAYKGTTTHTDDYGSYPAYEYYILSESGKLWVATTYAFHDPAAGGVFYDGVIEEVGSTGIRLSGVGDVTSGRYGSMFYDAELDYLIVSACLGTGNELYVFDPDTCAPVKLEGSFGEDVWPVTALYQYDSLNELTVKVDPETAEIYQGETVALNARVYLYESDDSVTWESDDETIATVDQNGLVTAVAPGTVTITATSVEGDASGYATITVKALTSIDTQLHAYITTDNGGKWVAIDGNDMTTTVLGQSDAVYTGAGVSEGKVYATDETNYYMIDPAGGYAVTQGDDFTNGDGSACLYMLDGASAPLTTVELMDLSTGEPVQTQVGGYPVYISGYDGNGYYYLTTLTDYTTGAYAAAPISYTYSPAAITYRNSEIIEDYWFDFYLILGYDGLLETYSLYTSVSDGKNYVAGGFEYDTRNIGMSFPDGDDLSIVYINDSGFEGIVISHAGDQGVSLYSYDLTTGELGKLGMVAEATDLVGLSLLSDVDVRLPEEPDVPDVPVTSDQTLHGYITTEEGSVWVSIDTSDMSVETLSGYSNVEYAGAGVHDGKIYAAQGVTKYGQTTYSYYMIDPENGYTATQGTTSAGWGYKLVDGTGAPAQTVMLFNEATEDYEEVAVGGYFVHASNGAYSSSASKVYVLRDYAAGDYTEPYTSSSAFSGKLAAITFVGGHVSGDELSYMEDFLILGMDGTLYSYQLVTTVDGLNGAANVTTVGTLDLTASGGASMALVDEDTVAISVNADDGVAIYHYTISTATLTQVGVLDIAVNLVGLSKLTDITGEEEPIVPDEPAGDHSLLGYLAVEEGYVWAKIDPEDMSYEVLAEDTLAYVGAGVHDGKIYAANGVTKYGQTTYTYYMIDPENGYAATPGVASAGWGYKLVDGTGAPAQTVMLFNEAIEDYEEVTVGGYFVHASNGAYSSSASKVYVLYDYMSGDYTEPYTSSSAFSGKLAAITYVNGSVSGDELAYNENFLILGMDGTLYSYQLVTTVDGLNGAANVTTVGTLELTASNGASMALVDEDTVMISVNADDGVALYRYTISDGTLDQVGTISEAATLVGLSLYTDVAAEANARPADGSTMSVVLDDENVTVEHTLTLTLEEDVDVTNGRIEVTYDPQVLTYAGASSINAYYSVNEEEGKLTVAYASAGTVTAGEVIAALRFSFDEGSLQTAVTVTVTERNEESGLNESDTVRIGGLPFEDVSEEDWFYEDVEYVYDEGLMKGMTDTVFAPNAPMTRAQLVTILYRVAGEPAAEGEHTFTDVEENRWYTDAVLWAYTTGVTKGTTGTTFSPDEALTRQQMVTFLYRFAQLQGEDTSARADLSGYTDADQVGNFARTAMEWAVASGLIEGTTETTLSPTEQTTRAQIAAVIHRYLEN